MLCFSLYEGCLHFSAFGFSVVLFFKRAHNGPMFCYGPAKNRRLFHEALCLKHNQIFNRTTNRRAQIHFGQLERRRR
jgi:hypothetical protein